MAAWQFERDGKVSREELGPGHVAEHTTIDLGQKTIALWSRFDARGLWGRFVDTTTGKPFESPFMVAGVEQDLQDPQTIATRDGPLLAWQAARVGWRLGKIAANGKRVEAVTTIPGEGSFLTAAATDDGIVTAVFSTGTDDDGSKHEWYATVRASVIVPGQTGKPAEPITLLKDAHGPGRGGYAAKAMAAPGYGAVLVAPQEETKGESFVTFLREPCPAK